MERYQVRPNFSLHEFIPREIYEHLGIKSRGFIHEAVLDFIQAVRTHFDTVVTVNDWYCYLNRRKKNDHTIYNYSGYRPWDCPVGSLSSQHKFTRAVDVKVKGVSSLEVQHEIQKHGSFFQSCGLSRIGVGSTGYTHLDAKVISGKNLISFSNSKKKKRSIGGHHK